ncbi:MAG: copper resistance protein CopC [Candidatus Rokubacteria bacterium]|nr:copper resistance protein CopC [Candidatus Rokubacteria bacterium]
MALLLWGAAWTGAHSLLDHADPRAASTVKTAPAQVRIWFTESLEPAFSSLRVVDEAGRRVDKGDGRVDPSNLKLLRVSLPPLPPGTYKVTWRVLSVDSHVTEGDFTFRVAP